MARIIFKENVLEKAQERIRCAFDDFERIVCTFSGGKDSLVTLHLVLTEAERRNRKVACVFLDQEAEWSATIVEVKRWMQHPSVIPYWGRMPFLLENSTGTLDDDEHYLLTYDPAKQDEWIHPYDLMTINEFPDWIVRDMFDKLRSGRHSRGMMEVNGTRYPDFYLALLALTAMGCDNQDAAVFGGIRANEALGRVQMCTHKFYRNINGTFVNANAKGEPAGYRIHPIYDWKGSDVWKYIYDNKLPYNSLYDKLYQMGMSHSQMRVSSVCHEMSLADISIFSEIEPDTWERVQKRLGGTNSFRQAQEAYTVPKKFPQVFVSWQDYRNYLFEALTPEDKKPILARVLARLNEYMGTKHEIDAVKIQIKSILVCDMVGVYVQRFERSIYAREVLFPRFGSVQDRLVDDAKQNGVAMVTEGDA